MTDLETLRDPEPGRRTGIEGGISAMEKFLKAFGEGGITEQDKAHLRGLTERGAHDKKVSRRLCADIRVRRHRGESSKEIAELVPIDLSIGSVHYHAGGKCQHYTDVPAVDSNGRVTGLMCGLLRQARWNGLLPNQLVEAVPFEIERSSISYHTLGNCTHSVDVPPFKRRTVDEEQCAEWRSRSETEAYGAIARTAPFTYSTVAVHCEGHCNHEHAPDGGIGVDQETIDRRERCRDWRQAVAGGRSPAAVADEAGVEETRVRRHITGSCEHAFDIDGAMPLRYNGVEWLPLEEMLGVDAPDQGVEW